MGGMLVVVTSISDGGSVGTSLGESEGKELGLAETEIVGISLGDSEGEEVGLAVSEIVGALLGASEKEVGPVDTEIVGALLGASDEEEVDTDTVGTSLGESEGKEVWLAVIEIVGTSLGESDVPSAKPSLVGKTGISKPVVGESDVPSAKPSLVGKTGISKPVVGSLLGKKVASSPNSMVLGAMSTGSCVGAHFGISRLSLYFRHSLVSNSRGSFDPGKAPFVVCLEPPRT
eukprot:scaffold328_cov130-Cylindrotheca_fusiformis.AAC.33